VLTLVDFNDQPVAGFEVTDQYEVIDAVTVTPDATGTWSALLVPNAELQTADGTSETAYRVAESGGAASATYWIVVTATSPSWVGDLITHEVGPAAAGELPGTWCTVTDVLTFTGRSVTQQDVTNAQVMLEALIHRVWRETDSGKRDYYWLQRATAWQAMYVNAHPELLTMMDVSSISQDGLSITFRQASQSVALYSPMALRILSALFRGSNSTIRLNSAFQKNRPTRAGVTADSTVPWTNI
jgi:hypothetical protein